MSKNQAASEGWPEDKADWPHAVGVVQGGVSPVASFVVNDRESADLASAVQNVINKVEQKTGIRPDLVVTKPHHAAQSVVYAPEAMPQTGREEWTVGKWCEHFGGRYKDENPMNYYEFGSLWAIAMMLRSHAVTSFRFGWNSCRNAMLAAAPQPTPTTSYQGNPATLTVELLVKLQEQRDELLTELKRMVDVFGRDGHDTEYEEGECVDIDIARAVIAKAEGNAG